MILMIVRHKFILLAVAVLIAFGVWWGLSSTAPPATNIVTEEAKGSAADPALVAPLLALRSVKLEGTIFSDPAFMSLKDFSTAIVPEAIGRTNPFAPLSAAGAPPSASTTESARVFSPRR